MSERRRAFRVSSAGRIALRAVAESDEHAARLRVAARSVPEISGFTGLEESASREERVHLQMLERMSCCLNRIDLRLQELCQLQRGAPGGGLGEPIPISLSASGMSAPVELPDPGCTLLELTLDLLDSSLPLIPALASVVRGGSGEPEISKPGVIALHFDEMLEVDRERIHRFATRIQRLSLRPRQRKESS